MRRSTTWPLDCRPIGRTDGDLPPARPPGGLPAAADLRHRQHGHRDRHRERPLDLRLRPHAADRRDEGDRRRDLRAERPCPDLARRADRPLPDDVPGDDERPARRRSARRSGHRVSSASSSSSTSWWHRSSCSLLATIFVADPELRTGLILYGLAPCIAMVIIFTYLAKGNVPMALVFVALNSVIQMLLIPVYARLLIGDVDFDVWVVAQSVVLYLGSAACRRRADPPSGGAARRRGGHGPTQAGPQRALDHRPALHAHRHVRAQGRPHPRASGDRPRDGAPDDDLLRHHVRRHLPRRARGCASPTRTPWRWRSTRPDATSRSPSPSRSPRSARRSRWPRSSGPLIEVPVMLALVWARDAPEAAALRSSVGDIASGSCDRLGAADEIGIQPNAGRARRLGPDASNGRRHRPVTIWSIADGERARSG